MSDARATTSPRQPAAIELLQDAWRFRAILGATSLLELRQRYAGSALGSLWIVLYPLVFLSIYLFLYMVIFQVRFPGMSELGYVVFVFAGLVPYLVMMESINRGTQVIRENIHLIKNVIMPVELVPFRLVVVSFLAQTASFGLLVLLTLLAGDLSWKVIFLPAVLALLALMILGIVFYVSSLGVVFNDMGYIVNLLMVALMFLSPIGFKPDMVPAALKAIVYANPVSYPLEAVRWSLMASHQADYMRLLAFPALALALFVLGTGFFKRFKGLMADHV
jgi:lipopolysaccharide transport system permease protein